ncbi:MAG TPA: glycosyltransferase [Acidimicrobiia bacterium]|nr:glycosyltransferase [Acidimicrobiia bacterium]
MPMSYGFLSTYAPTECGLATFTAALMAELKAATPASRVGVVRVVDGLQRSASPDVVHQLVTTAPGGEAEAAAILDGFDAVVVQHEYGIYGGPDGDQVLAVLDRLTAPVIVVLHTVLVDPTPHQREVLERVLAVADAVVTMTPTARHRLLDGYPAEAARVALIPHGAPDNRLPAAARPTGSRPGLPGARPTILTWGLLGPGKGIEWVIDALAALVDLDPQPRYRVVGETHPRVVERCGEAYRHQLMKRAAQHGVAHLVEFDDRYFATADLGRIIAGADVVILPYDSPEQVTSGVLVEALAAAKPVIATGFPHAVELLRGGAGLVVPHRDPAAMAAALRRVLTEPGLAGRLGAAAGAVAPQLLWPAVAERYRALAGDLVEARNAAVA